MSVVLIICTACGLMEVKLSNDSWNYIAASQMSPTEVLGCIRTIGYPLLLKVVSPWSPDYRVIPWIQVLGLFFAVFFLDSTVRRWGASPWRAFAVSTGVLYAAFQNCAFRYVGTDFPAMVMAIVTTSFLFWVSVSPKRILPWIGLTVSLACTYHIRPAYLFLVALAPCLGILFLFFRADRAGNPIPWERFSLALCGVSILPYLGWCLLRLLVVGHFGLVSFGGIAVVGIAVELLDREMIETKLPQQWKPLATAILQQRESRGIQSVFRGGGVIKLRQWELLYNNNVHRVACRAACRLYGDDRVIVNRRLSDFSKTVIRLNKGKYFLFLIYSLPRAVLRLVYCGWAVKLFGALAALLFAARVCMFRRRSLEADREEHPEDRSLFFAMFWLAVLFFLAKTFLVILVVSAISRYILPAGVFVPSVLLLWLFHEARLIRIGWRSINMCETSVPC